MIPERIDALRHEYTDRYVVVVPNGPNLARFHDKVGRVATITAEGRALVQFDGADRARYDLELDFLKVVDRPIPAPKAEPGQPERDVGAKKADSQTEDTKGDLSALERARLERPPEPRDRNP
ncbi:MAG: hypothetical protein JW809_03410 [Pirellulales bacterium]|nr:hypothetical protein [Pirellulales bacterium]